MSRNTTFIQRNHANAAGLDSAMPTGYEGWTD